MPSKATVTVLGHCGKDPILEYLPNWTPKLRFSVATNHYAGKDRDQDVTWWNVSAIGGNAEWLNTTMSKGGAVQVTGEPYNATLKNGDRIMCIDANARDVTWIGFVERNDAQSAPADEGGGSLADIPFDHGFNVAML